jgi:hypothetical protein
VILALDDRALDYLALDPDYPLLDLFWTMLMVLAFGLFLWALIVVFRDLFGRADLGGWGKAGWTVLVLVLPIIGALGYLIARGDKLGQPTGATSLNMDSYVQSVTGAGGYHNIHETVTRREALSGPTRQDSA